MDGEGQIRMHSVVRPLGYAVNASETDLRKIWLTVERAAPTAEMDETYFGEIKKWSGHGRPSRCGSDALEPYCNIHMYTDHLLIMTSFI